MTFHARLVNAGGAIAYGSNKGAVRQDERGMAEATAVGRAVVRMIKLTVASRNLVEDTRQSMPPKDIYHH